LTPGNGLYEQAGPAKDWTTTAHIMHPDNNLEMLMVRYQQGDFAAAAVLVDRISPQLHRFFAVQFASRPDADDLLQETWLRIHKVRHTYRRGEPVLPWFYAIARHVRVDHYEMIPGSRHRVSPGALGTGQPGVDGTCLPCCSKTIGQTALSLRVSCAYSPAFSTPSPPLC
jgi:Sigma-70 region 2